MVFLIARIFARACVIVLVAGNAYVLWSIYHVKWLAILAVIVCGYAFVGILNDTIADIRKTRKTKRRRKT